jgi:cytochrome c biogenesis protein CcmG, thiol:disulfide interchange protein DsbE
MKFASCILALMFLTGIDAGAQNLTSMDFHLRDINGADRSFKELLASIRGADSTVRKGGLIISFWALWCVPCQQEMKAIKPIFEKYKDRNIHYLAINTDNPRSIAKVKSWVAAQKLPYEFWLDPNSEVFKKLNGQSMPYSLIVDAEGKLIAKRAGFLAGEEKEIEADLKKIVE